MENIFRFGSTSSSCWQGGGGCQDSVVVGIVLLILLIPITLVGSFVYNLIYKKIPSQNFNQPLEAGTSSSNFDLKRSIISISILVTIVLVSFFGYWMIRDNQDAEYHKKLNEQSILCVDLVESLTTESEKCDGSLNPLKDNCMGVNINRSQTEAKQEDHYVNEKLYLNCMNQN